MTEGVRRLGLVGRVQLLAAALLGMAAVSAQPRTPGTADLDDAYRHEMQAEQRALAARIRLLPPDARERNARIGQAVREGDLALALQRAQELDAAYPEQADVQDFIASLLARDGQLFEALAHMVRATRLAPDNRWFAVRRAGIEAELGRLADALATVDALVARAPGWSIAHNLRAGLLSDLGREPEALAAYGAAIAAQPPSAQILCNRADLLRRAGRPADARADYRHALLLQPGYVRAEEGLAATP